jgi:hypothetical protein
MTKHLSFSNFLKNEEETYFTGMSKVGINKDDFKKFPQSPSFFGFGQFPINIGSFVILDFKKNNNGEITHVKVKQLKDPQFNSLQYDKDNRETIDKKYGTEEFLVPIEDVEKLLLQGQNQTPPQGSPQVSDAGGVV